MTDAQIDALESGEELNRLVCEAIERLYAPAPVWLAPEDLRFDPTFNWKDAIYAAELFGLFGKMKAFPTWSPRHGEEAEDARCCLTRDGGEWWVLEHVGGWDFNESVSHANTGPLAICRAILKLSARNT